MSKYIVIVYAMLFISIPTLAQSSWSQISNGEHSYKSLQESESEEIFFKSIPVKKIKGAELVLFNHRLAKSLGLKTPSDWKGLEKLILDQFAYMALEEGQTADKTWFASYYDGTSVNFENDPGRARGDGRAAFTGELSLKSHDNKIMHMDFMIKGLGSTGLGWTSLKDHKDGLLALPKAIQSFMQSEIAHRNNLEGTVDLAVIKIPIMQKSPYSGELTQAALSIRVGNQFRPAHFTSHKNNKPALRKIIDYTLLRDWGLTPNKAEDSILNFTKSMAEQSARYYDLNAIHISPIISNRTTTGTNVDIDSLRFLDANHKNLKYNWSLDLDGVEYKKQTSVFYDYIKEMIIHYERAGYQITSDVLQKTKNIFDAEYKSILLELWLTRIGFDKSDISKIAPQSKEKFYTTVDKLYKRSGLEKVNVSDQSFLPAAYFFRKIFRSTPKLITEGKKQDFASWKSLFVNNKDWASFEISHPQLAKDTLEYKKAVLSLYDNLDSNPKAQKRRIRSAETINKNDRKDSSIRVLKKGRKESITTIYLKRYLSRFSSWLSSKEKPAETLNREVENAINDMVDKGLPEPKYAISTVKTKLRAAAALSCSKFL